MLADIALLTDRRYEAATAAPDDWYLGNILADDGLLIAALRELGLSAVRLDWSREDVDWSQFRAAVFRTTWDYFDRFAEFQSWLRRAETQTALINAPELVHWNLDKHYLADLARAGVSVPETMFLERGSRSSLRSVVEQDSRAEWVVKPCVSGAARHTYRVTADNVADIDAVIQPLLAEEAFLVQPFQRSVLERGERSLMVIGGRVTHAIRKQPKAGDFRVQDDHGGTVHQHQATRAEIEFAERAIASCPLPPLYGRVDIIEANSGELTLMELELIEPELWLRFHPPAATAFAAALATKDQRKNNCDSYARQSVN